MKKYEVKCRISAYTPGGGSNYQDTVGEYLADEFKVNRSGHLLFLRDGVVFQALKLWESVRECC